MLQDFRIVHRLKPLTFAAAPGVAVWATCLRSLAFCSNLPAEAGDEVYTQDAAYRFLLEVACGLKSPIVGETEVFGQFKIFVQEWLKLEPRHAGLVQRILSDAKAIRSAYLMNMGVQSYGSWVRGQLIAKRVHILGAGQLVNEIYPYLAKQEREVLLHMRDPTKVVAAPKCAISERGFDGGVLIVAAPMSAAEIQNWLGDKVPSQFIDLRDTSNTDPVKFSAPVKTHLLRDIFSEIEKTKELLLPRLENVQREIRECSMRAATQSLIRPQGWEDLCA
jgi:glutamyl-tRNA reductase